MLAAAHSASAFPLFPRSDPVVEFYDVQSGQYFLTMNLEEAAAIDTGTAGPGWVGTGHQFWAHPYPAGGNPCFSPCQLVARFYAPATRSHFFSGDLAESNPGPGWLFEGFVFYVDGLNAAGNCDVLKPVYRLRDGSNYRYLTSEDERARMRAKGWIEEGLAFCTADAGDVPIMSYAFDVDLSTGKIQPSSVCEDESRSLGACMAVNNLPAPATAVPSANPPLTSPQLFGNVTGLVATHDYIEGPLPDPLANSRVFVQQEGNTVGVHVETSQRGAPLLSSVNPLYQFKTSVDPGSADTRVFPFTRAYETDAQISVKFIANVRTVNVRNSASQAQGHPTLEFIDQRSGHHLYFTTLVFSTAIPGNDYLAPDGGTGKVIVGTSFRNDSPYIRNFGSWTFSTPSGFVAENPWGRGGPFEYRMDRTEFARVLASARTVDPALSAAPEDYLLDNYHFNNEVYGDGEIGMNLGGFRLEIIRR